MKIPLSNRVTVLGEVLMFFITVTLACLFSACSALPGGIGSNINDDARSEAEKFWSAQVTKCGESYYRKEVLPKKDDYVLLYEMKDPIVLAEPHKLSEADRLNGVEWDGTTTFNPKASRVWGQEGGSWFEWKKGMGDVPELTYPMKKVKGQWSVDTKRTWSREETSKYVPVDCSKIPQD